MTDRDRFEAFLHGAGLLEKPELEKGNVTCYTFYAKSSPRVVGYSGFIAEVRFKEDGSLLDIGAWE